MKKSGKNIWLINFSLLMRVRIMNIAFLILAMYISSVFLFGEHHNIVENLKHIKLHGIVLSSVFSVMAGYIINYFYDQDKDRLYRPISTMLYRFVNQKTALRIYIFFNTVSLLIAGSLSFHIFIFFLVYQFLIWFYSHKLSRIVLVNNIVSSVLMIFPFLALFLFFENYSLYILYLALFLFLMILIRDICKDLHSYTFDDLFDYKTLPNTFGIIPSKIIINLLLLFFVFVCYFLIRSPHLQEIKLYYLLSAFLGICVLIGIWFMNRAWIQILIVMIKFWVFIGTISLLFIDGNPFQVLFENL